MPFYSLFPVLPNRTLAVTDLSGQHLRRPTVWFSQCPGSRDPAALVLGETFQLCQAGYSARRLVFNQVKAACYWTLLCV